jgi:hydrogenase maturation protease
MSPMKASPVVLGVGNILLRDDGVGVRVVEALGRLAALDPTALPAGTHLLDGGTLGPELLEAVSGARCLLIVDGVDVDEPPGTVVVLRGDALATAGGRHPGSSQGGVGELLALGRLMGWMTGPVALVGIQVAEVVFDTSLSQPVERALPAAVETARSVLRTLDDEAMADAGRGSASSTRTGARA